jgi:hypothetical protein
MGKWPAVSRKQEDGCVPEGQGTFGEEENLLCMTGIENRDSNVNIQLGHHTCPLRTAFLVASKLAGGLEKQS